MSVRNLRHIVPSLVSLFLLGCGGSNLPTNLENGDTVNDGTASTTDPQTAAALSGRIDPGQTSKARPRMEGELYPYTVVAQSNETGQVFRAATDADGDFKVDLPAEEAGNSFVVTILGPDGRAVGPVVLEQQGDQGVTGLALERDADLGTIVLPDDPTKAPITPGADGDVADLADPALAARLNADGAPIGLASVGKAAEALADETAGGLVDADKDGLIDILDADDDGDGTVDDFDAGAKLTDTPSDVHANFFMNLKIGTDTASIYYAGSAVEIGARLATDTVITLEVMMEPGATRSIASARMLETPGPAYLPLSTQTAEGDSHPLWSESDYAFDDLSDRFGVWIVPNAVMDAGDSFTLEVTFDDGTVEQYSRMINFVFKNIPKLLEYGAAGVMMAFDLEGGVVDGSPSHPILFDGTQDLVLVFNPPPDETGAPITGMDYTFQLFYQSVTDGQLNGDIDYAATWATPIPGFDRGTYRISSADLGALSAESTYSVTLPHEIFADAVTLNSGATAEVGSYKIDITAEAPSGNAAIMLTYAKQ